MLDSQDDDDVSPRAYEGSKSDVAVVATKPAVAAVIKFLLDATMDDVDDVGWRREEDRHNRKATLERPIETMSKFLHDLSSIWL